MALDVSDVSDVSPAVDTADAHQRTAIVELVGGASSRSAAGEGIAQVIRLRTDVAERDRRIAVLSTGLRVWRERAAAETAAHRRDLIEAHDREREIVSLLHQQMQVADAATEELERMRARTWWQRLRG